MTIQDILQDKKKLFILLGGLILIVLIIILLFSSFSNSSGTKTTSPTSYITNVVLAKSETSDKKAVNPSTVFSISDPEIHAIITINSLPANTMVKFQWHDKTNNKILQEKETSSTQIFSGITSSSITRVTDSGTKLDWGTGDYEFRVFVAGKQVVAKQYKVSTDADIEKNNIISSIKNIQLTTSVDLYGKPNKSISDIFGINDEDIYASVTYENTPKTTTFKAKWYYLDNNKLLEEYSKTIVSSGVFAFKINSKQESLIPTDKWPKGKYRLEIYLDQEKLSDLDFRVE